MIPHETFWTLLRDSAHWEFELFLMALFDGAVGCIAWPFIKKHWQHHVDRDRKESASPLPKFDPNESFASAFARGGVVDRYNHPPVSNGEFLTLTQETGIAPQCEMHNEPMVLAFYDRPGSPPGNGWSCRSCTALRTLMQLDK